MGIVKMPRKNINQTSIYVHGDVHKSLQEAKLHFEGLTGSKVSWSGYLYLLSAGALAMSALNGLQARCPNCGHAMELYYKTGQENED